MHKETRDIRDLCEYCGEEVKKDNLENVPFFGGAYCEECIKNGIHYYKGALRTLKERKKNKKKEASKC